MSTDANVPRQEDSSSNSDSKRPVPGFTVQLTIPKWDFTPTYTEPVYHYTSYDGLCAIVQTRALRASLITHLNDASEVQHGRKIVREALSTLNGDDLAIGTMIVDVLEDLAGTNVFVLCASTSGEDLTQMDRYGDVAIEVDSTVSVDCREDPIDFLRSLSYDTVDHGWRAVIYDHEKQVDLAQEMLRRMIKDAREHDHNEEQPLRANDISTHVMRYWYAIFVATCKNPAYLKEDEVRLVRLVESPTAHHHRPSPAFGIVPFVNLVTVEGDAKDDDWAPPPLPIRSVQIGHSCHPELAKAGIESLLARAGYKDVPVEVVENAYRR